MNTSPMHEITPRELVARIDAGEKLQIVDVRSPSAVTTGKIDAGEQGRYHNIPGSTLLSVSDLGSTSIDPNGPTVVVCSRGNDSKIVAMFLRRLGVDASSLAGGMLGWMNLLVPRTLKPPESVDHFVQFDRPGKGALSYVLVSAGEAIIIDPSRDIRPYLDVIAEAGARPVAVADTHIHADYISGGPTISRELGIPYYLHPADAIYPYDGTPGTLNITPVGEGTIIKVGRCSISVVATPGHSPGSVTYLVGNEAAFTGDFLFLLSVGRPDLAGKTDAWAPMLWDSIQSATKSWTRQIMIFPAHYSGAEARLPNRAIGAPLGELLRHNASLLQKEREEFLAFVREMTASFPEAYRTIKAINVGLTTADDPEAELLEFGKNECAL